MSTTQLLDDRSARLYGIRRKVMQMLRDRGYVVADAELLLSEDRFREKYGEEPRREDFVLHKSKRGNPNDQIFVFYPEEAEVGVKTINSYVERMNAESVTHAILIVQQSLTPSAKQSLSELSGKYHLEVLQEAELLVDVQGQVLGREDKVLTLEEKKTLLEPSTLTEKQCDTDEVGIVRKNNFQHNTMVEETKEESLSSIPGSSKISSSSCQSTVPDKRKGGGGGGGAADTLMEVFVPTIGQTETGCESADTGEDGILDLTSSQLHDLKEVELPSSLIELDLTANRLTELDDRISHMSLLKKLSLRQNLFQDSAVDFLTTWPALFGLQELVLRDNMLTKVPVINVFTSLTVLDLSFNKISSMEGLSRGTWRLKEVYLSSNAIQKIEELDHFQELEILELGSNKIREIDGIQNLTKLKELWLGRNRIRTVNLCGLTGLTRISVQSNRLTSMLGFQHCVSLEELYLSHNFIVEMEGLSTLTKLRILDVSSNKLQVIKDIGNLVRLEDLWLNDNSIPTLDGIEAALEGVKSTLVTIYLDRNPCAESSNYVSKLRAMLPKLVQIDSQFFD